jgi:hypothetical protein
MVSVLASGKAAQLAFLEVNYLPGVGQPEEARHVSNEMKEHQVHHLTQQDLEPESQPELSLLLFCGGGVLCPSSV